MSKMDNPTDIFRMSFAHWAELEDFSEGAGASCDLRSSSGRHKLNEGIWVDKMIIGKCLCCENPSLAGPHGLHKLLSLQGYSLPFLQENP